MNEENINYKSCFIGPRSENKNCFLQLIINSIISPLEARIENNENQTYFGDGYFESSEHLNTQNLICENTKKINNYLKSSVQFSSLKYQAHMVGDNTIPSILGNISLLLYNQNPIQYQFSNKVTFLEYTVCNDLNKMIGFDMKYVSKNLNQFSFVPLPKEKEKELIKTEIEIIKPFSHVSTGGTLSNIESMWCSSFVKAIPIAIRNAILNNEFKHYDCLTIKMFMGHEKRILNLTEWELLNIDSDIIVNLPYLLSLENDLPMVEILSIIKKYHISTLGNYEFCLTNHINSPVFIAPSTIHYSISKASSLLGLGTKNIKLVNVDENGRMDLNHLNEILLSCIENNIPVISLISLLGSTQEGSVDNLSEILMIRNKLRLEYNFNFNIHLDAAYGGYYLSILNEHEPIDNPPDQVIFSNNDNELLKPKQSFDPLLIYNQYIINQFKHAKFCDTITLDPHKTGYVPYACGVICYRNSKFKDLLAFAGAYIGGTNISSMGIYGIEGSRSGTSSSLYFSHSIIRPSKLGYGLILSKCLLNSKLLYFKLIHMAEMNKDRFNITFTCSHINNSKYNILKSKLLKSNGDLIDINEIESNDYILKQLSDIGSDLSVLCFGFNLFINDQLNQDYQIFTNFNNAMIKQFNHLQDFLEAELLLSSTIFTQSHGERFISNLIKSIGIKIKPLSQIDLPFLRIVIMDPFLSDLKYSFINQIVKIIQTKVDMLIKNLDF